MGTVKIVRDKYGAAKKNDRGQTVFTKEGVNFSLNDQQQAELVELINGLKDGSLIKIDPNSDDALVLE